MAGGYDANRRRYRMEHLKVGDPLTERELEVLRWASEGLTYLGTAEKMDINYATVNNHLEQVRRKLGAHTTAQAVAVAFRRGILT
jgi:LuxR family quorum sensing-dependent transcriptional regulator